jgi:hypothetical protein
MIGLVNFKTFLYQLLLKDPVRFQLESRAGLHWGEEGISKLRRSLKPPHLFAQLISGFLSTYPAELRGFGSYLQDGFKSHRVHSGYYLGSTRRSLKAIIPSDKNFV